MAKPVFEGDFFLLQPGLPIQCVAQANLECLFFILIKGFTEEDISFRFAFISLLKTVFLVTLTPRVSLNSLDNPAAVLKQSNLN